MADVRVIHVVSCFLTLFVLIEITGGLLCYQCIDAGDKDTDCRDASRLLNKTNSGETEEWKRNKYYKNCDNDKINLSVCMIETYSSGGNYKSYHRDCSDGKTFSFTGGATKLPRLDNLTPNNLSTCSYQSASNIQICVQLCVGDLCNGPQPPPEPEVVCYNVTDEYTGENSTVCGASTIDNIFGGLYRYHAFIPALAYMIVYAIIM